MSAAPGRLAALRRRRRIEGHAGGANVVPEHLPELVVGGLADEARLAAERRDTHHGVGDRSAGNLDCRPHGVVELSIVAASTSCMLPLVQPNRARNASSQRPMMSTMALPMPTTSCSCIPESSRIGLSSAASEGRQAPGWVERR